jgi:hypothetical protein
MKQIVRLEELIEEWKKDSPVDLTEPSRELIRIPILHSKYLEILTQQNMIVKSLTKDYNRLRRVKWEYYSGDLNNAEDLDRLGWDPIPKKIYKPDMPMWMDADEDLNKILLRKELHEEMVDFCKSVLKELNSRTYQVRSIIDWERFTTGPGNG